MTVIDLGCEPPNFDRGFMFPDKTSYPRGSRITFVCLNEYNQNGATGAVCLDDGWSEDPPQCLSSGSRKYFIPSKYMSRQTFKSHSNFNAYCSNLHFRE